MSLEASRCALPSAIRRAWLCGDAQRLGVPDPFSADLAHHGSDPGLHANLKRTRSFAATGGQLVYKPAASAFLLRVVSGRRLVRRVLRVRARAPGALAPAVVAFPAALLLSPGNVLRNDQVSHHRNS